MECPVTVLTSCYNNEKYLAETIESVMSQKFHNFEYLLIDDGSTDNTLSIINKYSKLDSRIVVLAKSNTGLTNSLNEGIRLARGRWIARLDADDISFPERLQLQYEYSLNNNLLLIGSACQTINSAGTLISTKKYPLDHKRLLKHLSAGGPPFPHSTAFFDKSSVVSLGGYREILNGAEDIDLWLRLSEIGSIACLDSPLIKLRLHNESMTAKNFRLSGLSCVSRVSQHLRNNSRPDPLEFGGDEAALFLNWVEERLEDRSFFEYARFRHDLSRLWQSRIDSNLFTLYLEITRRLLSKNGLVTLENSIWKSDIAQILANEWISVNSRT